MSPFQNLIFHDLSKLLMLLALIVVWILFFRQSIAPWLKKAEGSPFPAISLTLLLFMSFGFFYFVGLEQAFRDVPVRSNSSGQPREERQLLTTDSNEKSDSWKPSETLEEQTTRMIEQNKAENEEAKKSFLQLKAGKAQND